VENNLFAALQSVAVFAWLGLVYALKGTLLLLEWAFSLDLLNEAMREVREALGRLHHRVLGRPWFLAALSVAGLWGIWRGLVQRRAEQTLAGLAGTVGLMLVALVLINDPVGTVGHASRMASDASLGFMGAASSGRTRGSEASLARANERLFDALVVRPWCALQFGDVRWCLRRGRGHPAPADVWLAFPGDGEEREGLYRLSKGEDPSSGGFFSDLPGPLENLVAGGNPALAGLVSGLRKLGGGGGSGEVPDSVRRAVPRAPEKVRMQEKGGTFTRLALLGLIVVGLLGAISLLLYLAVRLVLAGLLALILLLLAPAMLLAPAFGDAGRATFVAWLKRLAGALAAKLIYSLLLAVVVVGATALAALGVGWFGTWLLQLAYWWGILLKRTELLGFVSVGSQQEGRGEGLGVMRAYYGMRAARNIAGGAAAGAGALPRRGGQALAAQRLGKAESRRSEVGLLGQGALGL
jgi:hypothetical protein